MQQHSWETRKQNCFHRLSLRNYTGRFVKKHNEICLYDLDQTNRYAIGAPMTVNFYECFHEQGKTTLKFQVIARPGAKTWDVIY